ncbi:MAG: GNAT family N-acetyltransferase [Candidatus Omnitrophica bacterium]|nr:GNAT family N-acetyltransferase [Candidatus Omnitrophota bacterium]
MAENNDITLKMAADAQARASADVSFGRLSMKDDEEYTKFLVTAHKGRFNGYLFKDPGMARRLWRWEYLDNPDARDGGPYIWICRIKGAIAGQACVMPVMVKTGDSYFRGGWFQDLIMLPEFRNTGIGYFLVKHVLGELTASLDIAMVSGTNEESYPLFKTLGFTDMGHIGRNIYVNALSAFFTTTACKSALEINEIKDIGESFNELWRELSGRFTCAVERDSERVKWRFVNQPYWRYRIFAATRGGSMRGYVVLKESIKRKGPLGCLRAGTISDIFFDPSEEGVGSALIATAARYFKGRADIIKCDILNEGVKTVVIKNGFFNTVSNSRFLMYPLNNMDGRDGLVTVAKDPRTWFLTNGDSDMDLS